ncbi:MAG: DUF488 domain-containing protein [Bacteroidales bacterium]|nr:DUF488 domain-containing protein [Bacteroidales bacterium]
MLTQKQSIKVYDFIPYRYGCFSYSVYADLNVLIRKGILEEPNNNTVNLIDTKDYVSQLNKNDRYYMQQIKSQFGEMTNDDLIRYTYINYPYWATRSEIAKQKMSKEEYETMLQSKPKNDKIILFTIGYEGISLEEYLNRLIKNDVKFLVDVRNNPFSMKYGFSKSQLIKYCENLDIKYIHFPEVGIQSNKRQALNTQADYNRLFDYYKETNLTQTKTTQKTIFDLLLQYKRIALTCFEANINQCHRKHLAEAITNLPEFHYELKHI